MKEVNRYVLTVIGLLNKYRLFKKLQMDSKDDTMIKECQEEIEYIGFLFKLYYIIFLQDISLVELSNILGYKISSLNFYLFYLHSREWNEVTQSYEAKVLSKFGHFDQEVIRHLIRNSRALGYRQIVKFDDAFIAIREYVCSITDFSEKQFLLPLEEKELLSKRIDDFNQQKKIELEALLRVA